MYSSYLYIDSVQELLPVRASVVVQKSCNLKRKLGKLSPVRSNFSVHIFPAPVHPGFSRGSVQQLSWIFDF